MVVFEEVSEVVDCSDLVASSSIFWVSVSSFWTVSSVLVILIVIEASSFSLSVIWVVSVLIVLFEVSIEASTVVIWSSIFVFSASSLIEFLLLLSSPIFFSFLMISLDCFLMLCWWRVLLCLCLCRCLLSPLTWILARLLVLSVATLWVRAFFLWSWARRLCECLWFLRRLLLAELLSASFSSYSALRAEACTVV